MLEHIPQNIMVSPHISIVLQYLIFFLMISILCGVTDTPNTTRGRGEGVLAEPRAGRGVRLPYRERLSRSCWRPRWTRSCVQRDVLFIIGKENSGAAKDP